VQSQVTECVAIDTIGLHEPNSDSVSVRSQAKIMQIDIGLMSDID
jgi:hypothetical protein